MLLLTNTFIQAIILKNASKEARARRTQREARGAPLREATLGQSCWDTWLGPALCSLLLGAHCFWGLAVFWGSLPSNVMQELRGSLMGGECCRRRH